MYTVTFCILTAFTVVFVSSLLGMLSEWEHVLSVLIYLELMVLAIYMTMNSLWSSSGEIFYPLAFLAVSACESVLGVSAMIMTTKMYGSDLVSNQSTSLW